MAAKNVYSSVLTGGYSDITGSKTKKSNTYADGIELLNPSKAITGTPSLNSAIKPNLNIQPINAGGGYGGGRRVTDEGVIIGGGAINTTFQPSQPSYGSAIKDGLITGNMGVTKMPTIKQPTPTQGKYSDYLSTLQNQIKAPMPQTPTANTDNKTAIDTPKTPATYEEYLSQQRDLLDKRKADADRQAEAAKERAAVDAQASYAQNMATYGTNAETLAQMGLQGGGYSDYINSQAYAQKRADVQQANVTEQAAKAQNNATYEDALAELNKSELEYKEKQQEKAESKQDKQSSIYASLWEGATNPNSGYTADGIAAIGREYGLSETQIAELQSIVAQTQAKSETDRQAAKYSELVSRIAGATSKDLLDTALSNKDITQEQYNSLLKTYQERNYNSFTSDITNGITDTASIDMAFNNGDITQEQYNSLKTKWNNEIDTSDKFFYGHDYESAKQAYNAVIGNSWCTDAVKNELRSSFYKAYESDITKESVAANGFNSDKADGKIVDINSSKYSVTSWGDYRGAGKNDEQDQLVNAYVKAAKEGKIAVGQVCKLNYGACASDEGYYIYIGDGKFVHYKETPGNMQDYKSKYYVPDGFKWSGNGSIKKK